MNRDPVFRPFKRRNEAQRRGVRSLGAAIPEGSGGEIRDVLAHNLKRLRTDQGLSRENLADWADIGRTYISSPERSVYTAGINVVDHLAKTLGVSAADLLTIAGNPLSN